MSDAFPFQIPERLPIRIEPCPIVEAIFEARFVGLEPWATMPGSVLDVDAWFGPMDADLFENGLACFGEAHQVIKGLFFGLLTPETLAKLNPVYE